VQRSTFKPWSASSGKVAARFPANFILGYPEEEYRLRDDVTLEQRKQVMEWLDENA